MRQIRSHIEYTPVDGLWKVQMTMVPFNATLRRWDMTHCVSPASIFVAGHSQKRILGSDRSYEMEIQIAFPESMCTKRTRTSAASDTILRAALAIPFLCLVLSHDPIISLRISHNPSFPHIWIQIRIRRTKATLKNWRQTCLTSRSIWSTRCTRSK